MDTFRMHALNLQATHAIATYQIIILISFTLVFFILKQMKKNMLLEG
jgi:hypothetical protein